MRSIHSAYNEFVEYTYIQKHTQLSTYKCILDSMHTTAFIYIQTTFLKTAHTNAYIYILDNSHTHVYTHIHDRGGGADATVARMHLYMAICVSMRTITYEHIQAHTACMCLYVLVCDCMRTIKGLYVLVCNCSHTNTYKHIQVHSFNGGICPPSPVVYVCVYM